MEGFMRSAKIGILCSAIVLISTVVRGDTGVIPTRYWYSTMSTQQWRQYRSASKLLVGVSAAAVCIGGALYLHNLWCEFSLAGLSNRQYADEMADLLRYERRSLGGFLEGATCVLVVSGILLAVTSSAHHCSLLMDQISLLQK